MNQITPTPYVSPPSDDPVDDNPFVPIVMVEAAGGSLAMLGPVMLGEARPHIGGRNVHALWRCQVSVSGGPTAPKPAPSIEIAQRRLVEHIRDWFAACGHPLPTKEKTNGR